MRTQNWPIADLQQLDRGRRKAPTRVKCVAVPAERGWRMGAQIY